MAEYLTRANRASWRASLISRPREAIIDADSDDTVISFGSLMSKGTLGDGPSLRQILSSTPKLNNLEGSIDTALKLKAGDMYTIRLLGYEVQYHDNSWYFDSQSTSKSENISLESLMFGSILSGTFQLNHKERATL
jgi:hypothetical protein